MSEEETLYSTFLTISNEELTAILSKIALPRNLIFSSHTSGLVRRIFPAKSLQTFTRILSLDQLAHDDSPGITCCFCVDDSRLLQSCCDALSLLPNHEKHLIVTPRITTICQDIIDRSGLKPTLFEWHSDIVPLDPYLFVVPAPSCFRHCYVDGDICDVFSIGRSLTKFQLIHGIPTRTFVAGSMSTRVFALLEQQKLQIGPDFFAPDRQFDELFILDRSLDLATPLLTQFSYGGHLDDRFESHLGYAKIPASCGRSELLLSDDDEIYANARALPISQAPAYILELLDEISTIRSKMDGASGTNQWNVHAKRAERLSQLKPVLEVHLNLLNVLTSLSPLDSAALQFELAAILQTGVDRAVPIRLLTVGRALDAVRLLCLDSVTSAGVKSAALRDFQRRLVARFGIAVAGDLANLGRAGLLSSGALFSLPFGKPSFAASRDGFRQIVDSAARRFGDDGEDAGPADVGAGYGNYVPLLARLVQGGLENGWEMGSPVDKMLGQMGVEHAVVGEEAVEREINGRMQRRILVFVVGGVTETEVQVIRQMRQVFFDSKVEFHVGSTNVISGNKLIREVCPGVAKAN